MKWIFSLGGPFAAATSHGEKAALHADSPSVAAQLGGAAYLEILALSGLLPSALLWFSPPQSLAWVLSALLVGPLLLGLHYGFVAGTGSATLTAGVLAGLVHFKPELLAEFPKTQVIGLLLVGMCAGQARDRWVALVRHFSYLNYYHQTRLQQFTGAYQLLQVSHAQLERRLAGGASSLRAALQRLKLCEPARDGARKEPLGGIASWLLDIMVEAGHLHTAAVYVLNERGGLQLPAVATVGKDAGLSLFNPLLRETLRTCTLTSVQAGNEAVHENVIAVVPLVDARGHIHGVVSINDMPFLNVHQDTFELLGLLGRHIGDILARRTQTIGEGQGACGLRESLERNLADVKRHALPAALIACRVVDMARRDACVASCCHGSRGLDQSWVAMSRKGQPVVLILLPLTDEAGVKSYLSRLENGEAGTGVRMRGVVTHVWMLGKSRRSADEILAEIGAVCDVDGLNVLSAVAPTHENTTSKGAL